MEQPSRPGLPLGWLAAFASALALLVAGVLLGEPAQVMMNAANICLLCMGLG